MSDRRPVRVGIVGSGNILPQYLSTLLAAPEVELVGLADLDRERAVQAGRPHGIPGMGTTELLTDSGAELLINLTVPAAHAEVSRTALSAGLHVYSEKPLALTRADGLELLELAEASGLQLACGPDTFLGSAFRKAQELLQEGAIGHVTGASAAFSGSGPEAWHPNPAFFYQPGAGPLFDLGPYYLTHLVRLLGRVESVSGSARISRSTRTIATGPHAGNTIAVTTPTTVNALLEFSSGAIATFSCSFDVQASTRPFIELHGSTGSMQLADPNNFGGTLRLHRAGESGWTESETKQPVSRGRGSAVLDLIECLRTGTEPAASASQAFHVLDVMHCILESAESGRHLTPLAP